MKKLFLIRHAKSSWKKHQLNDFDRPLNKRGFQNAPFMGKILASKNITVDTILSSPALRAKTTAQLIAKELGITDIVYKDLIYEASVENLLHLIKQCNNKDNTVVLIGHNPSLNLLASYWVDFNDNIPTCGILEFECNTHKWENISKNNVKFVSFEYPKKNN